ncbi:hypothetical protein LTR12_014070 [Friedmanniomyces endolithicus]|nr:hypothetical protein LTR74_006302 [Friedmanniomyces endolithicus]KAK1811577.1 hypothetical protein LTR12_014070 [Friedmanniomyces endolithicus]
MNTSVWTLEAITRGQQTEKENSDLTGILLLFPLIPLIAMNLLHMAYVRRNNRGYLFFIPSVYPICFLLHRAIATFMTYTGITISSKGFELRPALPLSCESTSVFGTRDTFPCHMESLMDWMHLIRSGGPWNEIWTKAALHNPGIISGTVLLLIVLGLLCVTTKIFHPHCSGCWQRREAQDWAAENDWWAAKPWGTKEIYEIRCNYCTDPELGVPKTRDNVVVELAEV